MHGIVTGEIEFALDLERVGIAAGTGGEDERRSRLDLHVARDGRFPDVERAAVRDDEAVFRFAGAGIDPLGVRRDVERRLAVGVKRAAGNRNAVPDGHRSLPGDDRGIGDGKRAVHRRVPADRQRRVPAGGKRAGIRVPPFVFTGVVFDIAESSQREGAAAGDAAARFPEKRNAAADVDVAEHRKRAAARGRSFVLAFALHRVLSDHDAGEGGPGAQGGAPAEDGKRRSRRVDAGGKRAAVHRDAGAEVRVVRQIEPAAVERDRSRGNRRAVIVRGDDEGAAVNVHAGAGIDARVQIERAAVNVHAALERRGSENARRASVLQERRAFFQLRVDVGADDAALRDGEAAAVHADGVLHVKFSSAADDEAVVVEHERVSVDDLVGIDRAAGRAFHDEAAHREVDGRNRDELFVARRAVVGNFHAPLAGLRRVVRTPERVGRKRPRRSDDAAVADHHRFSRGLNENAFLAIRRDERHRQRIEIHRDVGGGA